MPNRDKIIEAVEYFYSEIIDKYKELEKQIANESKLTSVFKKVDYNARISKLKDLKKKALNINMKTIAIDNNDEAAAKLKDTLIKCINQFTKLIDAQVSMNIILKSEGKKMEVAAYKKAVENVKAVYSTTQRALNELDVVYADL